MKRINIAIDGFSSCGKSTLAKQLAKHFSYIYIDSGAMYRGVTLFALQQGFFDNDQLDHRRLVAALDNVDISFITNAEGESNLTLNGRLVEPEIRDMHVSEKVSEVAAIPEVREKLVFLQQKIAAQKGVVMDGRDIGTNVMPDAEMKFFMTAQPEIRAQRRFDELTAKGISVSFKEVLENLRHRDELDSTRATNPLRQADDAIAIDNSEIGLKDQFNYVLQLLKQAVQ